MLRYRVLSSVVPRRGGFVLRCRSPRRVLAFKACVLIYFPRRIIYGLVISAAKPYLKNTVLCACVRVCNFVACLHTTPCPLYVSPGWNIRCNLSLSPSPVFPPSRSHDEYFRFIVAKTSSSPTVSYKFHRNEEHCDVCTFIYVRYLAIVCHDRRVCNDNGRRRRR